MATVLIVYGSSYGQTALIARNLAAHVRTRGVEVVVHDVKSFPRTLDPSQFDAVVVGGRVHGGKHPRRLARFVQRHLAALRKVPSAFYSVSMVVTRPEGGREEAEQVALRFGQQTGWKPVLMATFAGAIKYTKYNFILRWMMKRIARTEGRSTDTTRDYEYTDWNDVRRFGDGVVRMVLPPRAPEREATQPSV